MDAGHPIGKVTYLNSRSFFPISITFFIYQEDNFWCWVSSWCVREENEHYKPERQLPWASNQLAHSKRYKHALVPKSYLHKPILKQDVMSLSSWLLAKHYESCNNKKVPKMSSRFDCCKDGSSFPIPTRSNSTRSVQGRNWGVPTARALERFKMKSSTRFLILLP